MRVYNPSDAPVIVDADGRTVDGRGHADVEASDQVDAALADGRLVEQPAETAKRTTTTAKSDKEQG